MAVRIEIPEDIEHHLETQWGNLPRHALEALAIEGYRARVLSRSQVRRMLGFETGVEVDEFIFCVSRKGDRLLLPDRVLGRFKYLRRSTSSS